MAGYCKYFNLLGFCDDAFGSAEMDGNNKSNKTFGTTSTTVLNDLMFAKVFTMMALLCETLITGLFSLFLVHRLMERYRYRYSKSSSFRFWYPSTNNNPPLSITSLLNFSAGVLMFTTFVHLAPDVRERYDGLRITGSLYGFLRDSNVNLADLLFLLGFLIAFLSDELARLTTIYNNRTKKDGLKSKHEIYNRTASISGNKKFKTDFQLKSSNDEKVMTRSPPVIVDLLEDDFQGFIYQDAIVKMYRPLFSILAMSFHAIFEGISIGIEQDNPEIVYTLFKSLAIRRAVLGFCIGIELALANTTSFIIFSYTLFFSLVTPFGIVFGMMVLDAAGDPLLIYTDLLSFTLEGLSTGILMYVTIFEIMRRPHARKHGLNDCEGLLKVFAIAFGFFFMAMLQFVIIGIGYNEGIIQEVVIPVPEDTIPRKYVDNIFF